MLKLEIIGNLGQDATLHNTDRGNYLRFSVAHSSKVSSEKKITQWVTCFMKGPNVDKLMPYLTKGKTVYCCGAPQLNSYVNKNTNENVTELVLNVKDLEFLGGASGDSVKSGDNEKTNEAVAASKPDDDLPF